MKRKAVFIIVMAIIVMTIGATVAAVDPCVKYHYIAESGNYKYCRAYMFPAENTLPHEHRVTAILYIDLEEIERASSLYTGGFVLAATSAHHYTEGFFYPDGYYECPLP
ncbi:MAG: hypothetical protein KBA30_06970 [Clostridia bacterium]|nr:hypothetical protein [Clostridia bacterium]